MTRPTLIVFAHDRSAVVSPKVFMRTLLFATSKRGRVAESMYISVYRSDSRIDFTLGAYGDNNLVVNSGFFVGEDGFSTYHHFLLQDDTNPFRFTAGEYRLDFYIVLVGDRKHKKLFSQNLYVSSEEAAQLQNQDAGLFFSWSPSSSKYLSRLDLRPTSPNLDDLKKFFQST